MWHYTYEKLLTLPLRSGYRVSVLSDKFKQSLKKMAIKHQQALRYLVLFLLNLYAACYVKQARIIFLSNRKSK